jgi:DMSO/TMAO reductase YedYZ molybdopterin-dependent catalytic subunit
MSDKPAVTADGLIVRSEEPLNLEMPFSRLAGFTTPNESFYVRCHFPIPEINLPDWHLTVEGEVEDALTLTYNDFLDMPSQTIAATLECAGNNRIFLEPKVKGVQWELGAVGNAEWTGVPLAAVLNRAKVRVGAAEVILEGADQGEVDKTPQPVGKISFARSIPIDKAMGDVLLAYRMNGEKLSATHGFPLRAVVPGWYAMASVKWLRRIIVTKTPFNGYYQSLDYTYWDRADRLPTLTALSTQQVKAEIARPQRGDIVPRDIAVEVRGAAWSGGAKIVKVEVSVDSGSIWKIAELLGDSVANAWRLWRYDWHTPTEPGKRVLMARATDSNGQTQGASRDPDRGTYMINHLLPIDVEVR